MSHDFVGHSSLLVTSFPLFVTSVTSLQAALIAVHAAKCTELLGEVVAVDGLLAAVTDAAGHKAVAATTVTVCDRLDLLQIRKNAWLTIRKEYPTFRA